MPNQYPTNQREPLAELKTYPAFQLLRDKAEQHELQFRPKEAQALKEAGTFAEVIDSRTESAWNAIADCRRKGMNQHQAEEVGLPNILLPSEQEEAQVQQDLAEQMAES
jgi:hypothetical protein